MYFEKEKIKKVNKLLRNTVCIILFFAVLFVYTVRLLQLQIIDYDHYASGSAGKGGQTVAIKASRGEILDRYGRAIAVNRKGYNIVFDDSFISSLKINDTILTLVNLLQKNKEEYRDKLPISKTEPYTFIKDREYDASALKKELGLNHYATAQNCVDTMIEDYKLGGYSKANQRVLMSVRYTMALEDFSVSYPYTFAEDVSEKTRDIILESSEEYPGVIIEETAIREYKAGDVLAQIVGNIGPIYAEDWEELKKKGYSYSDYVGKSGVEAAFEDYLRGKDGLKRVTFDSQGKAQSTVEQEAQEGNTVMLTIDLAVQRVAQKSINKIMDDLRELKINPTSASVVVVNVNNGEIIASANNPSYTLDEYNKHYDRLIKDESNPLFNRAFGGAYPPGSTFKAAVAAIGLTTGVITPDEDIFCGGVYSRYNTFTCLHYHGSINVVTALSQSCNIFFYETGRRVGISTLNSYCKSLGLGVKTGVEISETSGVLAGPSYANSINALWNPGDTLQASIGQSYNLFSPLQLATYTATIANGGTRHRSHLLYQVKNASLTKTVKEPEDTVLAKTGLSKESIDVVKRGMLSVAFDGTASSIFGDYPLQIGGKTGTAQTNGDDNGLFISFAPYKDSEIAVAVVVEHGQYGYRAANVVKDIFDEYFYSKPEEEKPEELNTLLP